MAHFFIPSLLVGSALFLSANHYSNHSVTTELPSTVGFFLPDSKIGWRLSSKPSQLRFFSEIFLLRLERNMAPCFWGKAKIMMFKRKKCWICPPILPWVLRGSLSLAGEAANPPRGREKWRYKVSAKKRMSSQFSAIGSSHKTLRSRLQHPHSYSYLFNFVGQHKNLPNSNIQYILWSFGFCFVFLAPFC